MHTFSPLPRTSSPCDPFQQRYGLRPLPRGLREEAAGMGWGLFLATYSPAPELSIAGISAHRLNHREARYGMDVIRYSKIHPPRHEHRELIAAGPVSACSAFLAEEGRPVEILRFHQHSLFQATATFLLAHHGPRTAWAMGLGSTPDASAAQALSCAAQRLHG